MRHITKVYRCASLLQLPVIRSVFMPSPVTYIYSGILQVVPVLLSAVPLKEDFDEVAPVSSALAAMLLNPELAPRLAPLKSSIFQVIYTSIPCQERPLATSVMPDTRASPRPC